jgi:hypothetical protein
LIVIIPLCEMNYHFSQAYSPTVQTIGMICVVDSLILFCFAPRYVTMG